MGLWDGWNNDVPFYKPGKGVLSGRDRRERRKTGKVGASRGAQWREIEGMRTCPSISQVGVWGGGRTGDQPGGGIGGGLASWRH